MTAYRYWRMWVGRTGGTPPRVFSFELRAAPGGANLAVTGNGSYTASSDDGTNTVSRAFDSNNTTYWGANAGATSVSEWLQWDFGGNTQTIVEFAIWRQSADSAVPTEFLLYASNDANAWTLVAFYTGIAVATGTLTLALNISAPLVTKALSGVLRNASQGFSGVTQKAISRTLNLGRDMVFGGAGRIVGTVKEKHTPSNLPLRRKVALLREPDLHLVAMTWSAAADGSYTFEQLDESKKFTAISFDHTGTYESVCASNLAPTP